MITVSDHAMWRAAERFPGFDTALIEEEVRSAIEAGRIAPVFEHDGFRANRPGTLYAWTPDRQRIYALHTTLTRYIVTSTLRLGMKGRDPDPEVVRPSRSGLW